MNFELLEERANDGDVTAIRQLVECYKNGIGVEQDLEVAEQWKKMLPNVDENSGEDSFSGGELRADAQNGTQRHDVDHHEKETEHQDRGGMTPFRERSWEEIRHELEKMSFVTLDQVVARGNYLAELIAGERYLKSSMYDEQMNGAERIRESIEHIKNGEVGAASTDAIKDALSEGWTQLSNYYIKYRNFRPGFAEKAFEACSNAFEIDHSNVDGLITCYKEGIGCVRDESKISTYERYKAEAGGIIERYRYAKSLGDGSIAAIEFLQKALRSSDADEHPYYKSLVRLSLAERGEKDIEGEFIDAEVEKRIQNALLDANTDPDAIEINRKLAAEEERQRLKEEWQRREEEKQRLAEEELERAEKEWVEMKRKKIAKTFVAGIVAIVVIMLIVVLMLPD